MSAPRVTEPQTAAGDDAGLVWSALLTAAGWARMRQSPQDGMTYGLGSSGRLCAVPAGGRHALMLWQQQDGWSRAAGARVDAHALLDLYLPICGASSASPLTVGHLGQSLDGYIATGSGDSNYVTGPDNILHLHRMRALCDAVVVGAETVARDDPELTTRLAQGDSPVRVVLDPNRRLAVSHRVFSDGQAPTLLVCDEARVSGAQQRFGSAEVLGVSLRAGRLDLETLLRELHARQLFSVFIEGGGTTVSGFLENDLLDRLQVAIAPLVTGAGRPGIRLVARRRIDECIRPPHRIFSMGDDVLFDCDLRADAEQSVTAGPATGRLNRVF